MKLLLEEGPFIYSADWSRENRLEDGWLNEHTPSIEEMLDAVFHLLKNIYPADKIDDELKRRYGA